MAHKREFLEKIAGSMNKVMSLNPPIAAEGKTDAELLEEIKANATGNGVPDDAIRADDAFDKETWAFFVEVGVWEGPAKAPAAEEAVEKKPVKAAKAEKPVKAVKAEKPAKVAKAAKPVKAKAAKPAKVAKVKIEVDKYGFRLGTKKHEIMKHIEGGKATKEALRKKFGGQVHWAVKESQERSKTKIKNVDGVLKIS